MTKPATPALDAVQRWQDFASSGLSPALPNADERAMFLSLSDVRAAYAADLDSAVKAARREAFGEVIAKMRECLVADEGPHKTDHERGAIQTYLSIELWATIKRDAVQAGEGEPKPTE